MAKKGFNFDGIAATADQQQKSYEEKEKASVAYIKKNLTIYEEFKFLVPPLTADELHKLELSIKAEGCRDPLVIWQKAEDEWVLIDGHNRYVICENNNIDFNIVLVEFKEYDDVSNWIVNNQLGKRNATEETKSYLRGLQYSREKKRETNWQNLRQYVGTEEEGTAATGNTAERLGELHKVSEKTIKRDEKFAIALDKLCGENYQFKSKILQRNLILPKGKLTLISDEPEEKVRELGLAIEGGMSFIQAFESIFPDTAILDFQTYTRKKTLKSFRDSILQSFENIVRTGNKTHLEDIRKYLDELEQHL